MKLKKPETKKRQAAEVNKFLFYASPLLALVSDCDGKVFGKTLSLAPNRY